MKQRVAVVGNAQAGAIARMLQSALTAEYEVVYVAQMQGAASADILCLQTHDAETNDIPIAGRIIRFPLLRFELLWPLTCINPHDEPEHPAFPNGRFPYGDSYVSNCVAAKASPDQILPFTETKIWPASWPDLSGLLQRETARLTSLDASCDVEIAPYILRNFAVKRLFHAPNAPALDLLHELASRLCDAITTDHTLQSSYEEARSESEPFSSIQVPIHPFVAQHFMLGWYDASSSNQYFQERISRNEYFTRMIAHSYHTASRVGDSSTLLVYGNCQAEAIASMIRSARLPGLTVLYLRSFTEPGTEQSVLDPRDVMRSNVLWEQHDEINPFPYAKWLPPRAIRMRFPAADFNALWPLTCVNPYSLPQPPRYPFGQFSYGDRALIELVDAEMPAEEIYKIYLSSSIQRLPNLDRMLAIEEARLRARDAKCDIAITDTILSRFRQERLFWTVNHPASALLGTLAEQLIDASRAELPILGNIDPQQVLRERFAEAGPLGVSSIPIHPEVARVYGLSWYDASRELFANWGDAYTYEGYFRAMIAEALAVKSSAAVKEA